MAADIILERRFDPPRTPEKTIELVLESEWCYEMYRVDWRASFLSTDGRDMVCWFAAPDAESARVAVRRSGANTSIMWNASVHDAPAPAEPNVLVARSFETPVTFEEVQAAEDASAWCLQTHQVRFVRTFFSGDRKRMLCLYRAPDAEAVRLAQREARLPFDAIWPFRRIDPGMLPRAPG